MEAFILDSANLLKLREANQVDHTSCCFVIS